MSKKTDSQARDDFKYLSHILETGKSQSVQNIELGDIYIDKGLTGKNGYGLLHIIEGRHIKDKLNKNEIAALLYKVKDSTKEGRITNSINIKSKNNEERIGLEKDGIIAIASRRKGTDEKFVITGYEINNKKEEAAEAIQTVIAKYGHSPEFSDFRKQVGAVVSSLQQVSPASSIKSSEKRESVRQRPKNTWFQYKIPQARDEYLKHTFGDKDVQFGIKYSGDNNNSHISFIEDGVDFWMTNTIGCKDDILKQLVENTIEHFDQINTADLNLSYCIRNYLESQINLENQIPEPAIKDTRQNESLDRQLEQAKKTGYVQGVCECVAIVGEDKAMGMKLLSEMKVTKSMAKQYAEPETYKALEQTVFAPKVEHKRGRAR